MDLILIDKNFTKIEPIRKPLSFDSAVGLTSFSDNDFVLKMPYNKMLFDKGQFVSYGLTEYGGRIVNREIDTKSGVVTYKGYTIRGLLKRKYKSITEFSVSGTVADHVAAFIGWESNDGLLEKADVINNVGDKKITLVYQGATSLLHCIDRALKNFNASMDVRFVNNRLKFVITPAVTHRFDSSQVNVVVDENWSSPTSVYAVNNDLRIGAYAYLQEDGTAGKTPFYSGVDAIEDVISSDKMTEDELYELAADELLKKQEFMASEILLNTLNAEVGDMVVASIAEIGIKIEKKIVEKRFVLKNNKEKITYTLEG